MDAPRPGWPMWKRIAVRVALVPVIFVVVSAGTFWLLYGPLDGSPADDVCGNLATGIGQCPPELIDRIKHEQGWDDPLLRLRARLTPASARSTPVRSPLTNSLFIGGWLTLLLFGFLLIAVRLATWRQDAEQAAADADS